MFFTWTRIVKNLNPDPQKRIRIPYPKHWIPVPISSACCTVPVPYGGFSWCMLSSHLSVRMPGLWRLSRNVRPLQSSRDPVKITDILNSNSFDLMDNVTTLFFFTSAPQMDPSFMYVIKSIIDRYGIYYLTVFYIQSSKNGNKFKRF